MVVRAFEIGATEHPLDARQRLGRANHQSPRRLSNAIVNWRMPSALVGDRQSFPTLGTAPLEHGSPVLGGHANPEAVSLLPAARVRLVSALSLHPSGPVRYDAPLAGMFDPGRVGRNFNTSWRFRWVSILRELQAFVGGRGPRTQNAHLGGGSSRTKPRDRRRRSDTVLQSPVHRPSSPTSMDELVRWLPQDFHNCGKRCGNRGIGARPQ